MPDLASRCGECRFFAGAAGRAGACRRNPPALLGASSVDPDTWSAGGVAWPRVLPDWWCGEFEATRVAGKATP